MPVEFLDLPPADAVRHFRAKGMHVGFGWRSTAAEAHAVSFTVAKAMRFDILRDLRAAVDRTQAEGVPFREFVADLKPRLQRLGWWGRTEIKDPATGEPVEVLIGPRRLRTIFDANLASSAAAGQWRRIERTKEAAPFLRYESVLDDRTRPEHRAWDGVVLPADHEFWTTHFPPNGWRCRCTVTQWSAEELAERGWEVSEKAPDPDPQPWYNRRTETWRQVPRGIDPGWDRNPGKIDRVAAARALNREKFGAAGGAPRRPTPAAPETPTPDALAAKALAGTEPDDFIGEGHERRLELERAAGIRRIATDADAGAFHAALLERLRRERGADDVKVVVANRGRTPAVREVEEATRRLPRSWVEAGNTLPPQVARDPRGRGSYSPAWRGKPPRLAAGGSVGNAVHEYTHHLQRTLGEEFNAIWREIHRRRTTWPDGARHPVVPLYPGDLHRSKERGRPDYYARAYAGREYAGDPREVATMHLEAVLGDARDKLLELAELDEEMLDLTIGMLFHFGP